MKIHKFKISTLFNAGCASLLSILGFTAASCDDNHTEMYGTPYVNFNVTGQVTNEKGNPISDATVTAEDPDSPPSEVDNPAIGARHIIATAHTDASGRYMLASRAYAIPSLNIVCRAGDKYESAEEAVSLSAPIKDKKDDNWCWGTVNAEVNFTLRDKQSELTQ